MDETGVVVDRPLADLVVDLIDADGNLAENAKYLILGALESTGAMRSQLEAEGADRLVQQASEGVVHAEPRGAFVTSISVAGFRGIGPEARLDLHPAPGLTIVSGRNGSGKSSFAEALEYAITGASYRWRRKSAQWMENWRNLDQPSPCSVRIGLAVEGSEPTVLGVDWPPDATLVENLTWCQVGNARRKVGTDPLGWGPAIEMHRPILSYEEIGGLFDEGPSALYDALAKLLGLEQITDAEKRLADELVVRKAPRKVADDKLRQLKGTLAAADDERAVSAAGLLKRKPFDLDALGQLAIGADASDQGPLTGLRAIANAPAPDIERAGSCANSYRVALTASVDSADEALKVVERRSELLGLALQMYEAGGDVECPVCRVGQLSEDWKRHVLAELEASNERVAQYRQRRLELSEARTGLLDIVRNIADIQPIADLDLAALGQYRDAVTAIRQDHSGDSGFADFIEAKLSDVVDSLAILKVEAQHAFVERENKWTPVAEELVSWVQAERAAREADPLVKLLDDAKKWVTANASALRNDRMGPIADQARAIWAELRQQSNVDLVAINLEGQRTHRKAKLEASVDGKPAGALSVMSQGELHALALALFIPRATMPNSPFRFVVLDDPIQAMDPAKIDGFVKVLSKLAENRQVVVFSHDDRLASAIRQTAVDAKLIEVTRAESSAVSMAETVNQAERYATDAYALILDADMPDEVKARVAPGLFRFSVESAAQDVFYAKRHRSGASRVATESDWLKAKKTNKRVALAVHGDPDGELRNWFAQQPYRSRTLSICNRGAHQGSTVDRDNVKDLRKTIRDLQALR